MNKSLLNLDENVFVARILLSYVRAAQLITDGTHIQFGFLAEHPMEDR